ncbi:hypothetical protein HK104_007142 [Borealophlyctis nickersoniae]|nr:hypothetical protein HK104_007142 [Borealophlyctis nickersoniae]
MQRQIIGQAIYQFVACMLMWTLCGGRWAHNKSAPIGFDEGVGTLVFNAFVMMQVFNEINSRSITRDINIFRGITKNYTFLGIVLVTILLQAIIVEFGGEAFHTNGLDWSAWLLSIGVGAGSIPVGILIRLLPELPFGKKRPAHVDLNAIPADAPDVMVELNNRATSQEPLATPIVQGKDSDDSLEEEPTSPTVDRWRDAIGRTQMQIRVVNAFRPPTSAAPEVRSNTPTFHVVERPGLERRRSEHLWTRAREVPRSISVVNAFRGGRRNHGIDFSALQMVDPSRGTRAGVGHRRFDDAASLASTDASVIGKKH